MKQDLDGRGLSPVEAEWTAADLARREITREMTSTPAFWQEATCFCATVNVMCSASQNLFLQSILFRSNNKNTLLSFDIAIACIYYYYYYYYYHYYYYYITGTIVA